MGVAGLKGIDTAMALGLLGHGIDKELEARVRSGRPEKGRG